jgi:hypothetical protein
MQDMPVRDLNYSLAGPDHSTVGMGLMVLIKSIQSSLTSILHFDGTWPRSIRYEAPPHPPPLKPLLNLE